MRRFYFYIFLSFIQIDFVLAGILKNRFGMYEYDTYTGHHNMIKAGVEKRPFLECPFHQRGPDISAKTNFTLNVICDRKTKSPVIGACRWRGQDREANFEKKPLLNPPAGFVPSNESTKCACGIEEHSLGVVQRCAALEIEGTNEKVRIFTTSLAKITVNEGSPVEFSFEYTIAHRNESSDGHSLLLRHWYNSAFSNITWHVVHGHFEPKSPNRDRLIYRAYMRIDSATVEESGLYAFEISYDQLAVTLVFSLNVRSEKTRLTFYVRNPPNSLPDYDPFQSINPRFLQAYSIYEIVCAATIGDFDPNKDQGVVLRLYRSPCIFACHSAASSIELTQESIDGDRSNGLELSYKRHGRYIALIYKVQAKEPGLYQCSISSNDTTIDRLSESTIIDTAEPIRFIPTDISNAVEKRGVEVVSRTDDDDDATDSNVVYDGDRLILECRYQRIDYRFERWQFVGDQGYAKTIIHSTGRYTLDPLPFPARPYEPAVTRLIVDKIDTSKDSGRYICELTDRENGGKVISFEKRINVLRPIAPAFHDENVEGKIEINETDSLKLRCLIKTEVIPSPSVIWSKDGQPLLDSLSDGSNAREFEIRRVSRRDAGNYTCVVKNRAGMIRRDFLVAVLIPNITLSEIVEKGPPPSLLVLLVVLSAFVVILTSVLTWIIVNAYRRRKRLSDLHRHLISSTKDNVAPLIPNMPVNQQPENLPYDTQYEINRNRLVLGVLLGEGKFGKVLEGYVFSEDGERTTHVAVKIPKDGMDVMHQRLLLSEFKIMAYVGNHVNVVSLLAAITHRMPKGELYVISEYCEHGSLRDYLTERRSSFVDELVFSSLDKNGYILSNEFIRRSRSQPAILDTTSNYYAETVSQQNAKCKGVKDGSQLSTSDLLRFAYQVSNGMDYLASKNVVHRDLALRNILLTKDMLVKIGDFGLALHQLEEEKPSATSVPLPVKWMALESVLYGEYSVKSDVWSFGIVLWEIFSLAETPYPDKAPCSTLGEWLLAGNRLGPPKYAPEEIYHLMTRCWREQPQERPSFPECRDMIGVDFHLRSPDSLESLKNLLDSYHSYVNAQGSVVSDEDSPSARLLKTRQSATSQFWFPPSTGITTAVENPDYNQLPKYDYALTAVENLSYANIASDPKGPHVA